MMTLTLIVKKTGVGQDRYPWDDVVLELDHGVLMIRDEDGVLIHAYSPAAWLEVVLQSDAT